MNIEEQIYWRNLIELEDQMYGGEKDTDRKDTEQYWNKRDNDPMIEKVCGTCEQRDYEQLQCEECCGFFYYIMEGNDK